MAPYQGWTAPVSSLTEETPWLIHYYPAEGPVGLVEFLLEPTEEELAASIQAEEPAETEESEEPPADGEGVAEEIEP